jgi:hypothetical protein
LKISYRFLTPKTAKAEAGNFMIHEVSCGKSALSFHVFIGSAVSYRKFTAQAVHWRPVPLA